MSILTTDNTTSSITPSRYRIAVFGFFFCQGLVFASWASRIPLIMEELGLSEGQLGTLLLMMPTVVMAYRPR